MELDVTHMVNDADTMPTLSGSVAELGRDAGKFTWENSVAYARENPLLADDTAREEARQFFQGFGAWSQEEIASWSDEHLNGMVVQFVAGDIREMEHFETYEEYEAASEVGRCSGRLYRGADKRWWFYLGE